MIYKIKSLISEFENSNGFYPRILLLGLNDRQQFMKELKFKQLIPVDSKLKDIYGGHYYNLRIIPVTRLDFCEVAF